MDRPTFAGLSDGESHDGFHLRGIAVEMEPYPEGFDEIGQLVDMGNVTVDRFDCRLLLDPLDLHMILKTDKGHPSENESAELDDVRYGDLYAPDGGSSSSQEERHGGTAGEYGAVAFSYGGATSFLIPPPPPYPRVIVEQSLQAGTSPPPCVGPLSLRQVAVMNLVAKYTADLERRGMCPDNTSLFHRFEFVDRGHAHHVIFRGMVDRWKASAGIFPRQEESKPESIAMLLEYRGDEENEEDAVPFKERITKRVIQSMVELISTRSNAAVFLGHVKDMHAEGGPFFNIPEARFQNVVEDLEKRVMEKTECQERVLCNDNVDEGTEEDDFFSEDEGAQFSIDESKLAARRKRAQMLLKKRKHDHEEKSKLLRKKTVEDDRLQREKAVSAIQQHRKMFQDSDEEECI